LRSAGCSENHIGDIDLLWAPIEKEDKADGTQMLARYDPKTLRAIDWVAVPQHHNSFVAVDDSCEPSCPAGKTSLLSTDLFDDDTVLRYTFEAGNLTPVAPLKLRRKVDHIQGADVAGGALWLATDDDHDGLYRVDLQTGDVQDLGSMGHADGEGEGIDVRAQAGVTDDAGRGGGPVLLAVLSIDPKAVPVRVIDVVVSPAATR
jgi:hypothetical protein